MNKSTLLVLALAMLVPTVALADGVTVGGDLRLRWDYSGPETNASSNSSSAVTNIDLGAAINDNVSFAVSLRNDFAFGDAGGVELGLQEAYASIGDLGSASGVLAGWSLDVGRMNNPDYGRIINSDDWAQDAAPASSDGYHLASDMGGIGIDIYYFGGGTSPAGNADSTLGANFGLGDMAGFADISVGHWSKADKDDLAATVDSSNTSITINNIGGDNLAGVDLDVQYATSDDGDDATEDGTLTSISASYALGDMGMTLHVSNTIADGNWTAMSAAAHGTNGIADLDFNDLRLVDHDDDPLTDDEAVVTHNVFGSNVENFTIGLSFSPMDGVDATVSFLTLSEDTSGDDTGTEVDLVLGWDCGSDVRMNIGYASFSADDASGLADSDFFYLQTGWDF